MCERVVVRTAGLSDVAGRRSDEGSEFDVSLTDGHGQIDSGEIAELYRDYAENLRRLVIGILRDQGLADEVLQTVFGRLIERSDSIRDDVRGWLFRVASNEAIQVKRRQAREQRAVDQAAWQTASRQSGEGPTDGSAIRNETVADVRRAIDSLPDAQQQIVRMRIYENKTFAVIANELGVPLGTVLTRMRLATERLQQALKKSFDQDT
ncbi:sigma-70 family RNA polymerase sigma factor [bacterium]|nr:sigma-70 family RNA polymerase sigma factor [bacterium]